MKVFVCVLSASMLVVCLAQFPPNPEESWPVPSRPPGCPEPMCANRCKYGLKKNAEGCETCNCKPSPCEGKVCEGDKICVVSYMECMMDAPCFGFPKCVPRKPCPNIACMMACPAGMKVDEFGCQMCECKDEEPVPEPKDHRKCGERECMHGQHCVHGRCEVKPWCHRMHDYYRMKELMIHQNKPAPEPPVPGRMMMHHRPECEKDGAFKPRQCHEHHCWCVHDNGTEVEGTRKPILEGDDNDDDHKSECERRKPTGALLHFHMHHNLPNVDSRMDHIKKLMYEHISRWMIIEREDIIQVNVRTHEVHVLRIEVAIVNTGKTDLSSALMHFHEHFTKKHLNVEVEPGKKLEPMPKTVQIEPQYTERRIVTCWNRMQAFYHKYPIAVISGTVAAGLLLLLSFLSIVLACCCKSTRGRQKYEIRNYDKNLCFDNQLYNCPEIVTGDAEKVNLAEKEKEALA